jgi:hydroxyacylglutathione hydrolase
MIQDSPLAARGPSGAVPPHPAVSPIAAFSDNYIWLLRARDGRRAAVVDPGDAAPVQAALAAAGLDLAAVLVTHHHADHVGGLPALRAAWPRMTVHGPAGSEAEGIDQGWLDGETLELEGFDARFTVIGVPGHTLDHIAWYASSVGAVDPRPVLFCGDTLFAGGCGRVFEGTPAQMNASLGRLAALPDETLVYCAHEYTTSNLRFARAVEPDSPALAERERAVAALRAENRPTVPSTLGEERRTNPFLRSEAEPVRAAAGARLGRPPADAVEVFAAIRQWKDGYRG